MALHDSSKARETRTSERIVEIYRRRFSEGQNSTREATWRVLVPYFFQRFIRPQDVVVDLGAGDGLFLKYVAAARRIAVDLAVQPESSASTDIQFVQASGTSFSAALDEPVDVIFMSNFLEHMRSKDAVLEVLEECRRALRHSGRVLILQPNIRYAGAAYWDYIDHHVALTDVSLVEALEINGFTPELVIPRFLPYTVKSSVGRIAGICSTEWLVRMYLKFPLLWRLCGKQSFIVARRN